MDGDQFDTIVRQIAGRANRRSLLGGLAGAATALLSLGDAGAARRKRRRRTREVIAQGPCGNGRGKANRCKRDRQCCTGYCDKKKKRCRCRKPGQSCNEDRNCCPGHQGMACVDGQCQPGCPTPLCGETCCTAEQRCVAGACELPCGAGGPCTVFVSSTTHTGSLGGLTGADTICNALADAAGLGGTFMAWLSADNQSPSNRFLTQSTGPYRRVDGVTIAEDWTDLIRGTLQHPIDVTEGGGEVGAAIRVFSDTKTDGHCLSCGSFQNNCAQWTSAGDTMGNYGVADASNGEWTNRSNSVNCSGWESESGDVRLYRLYCFQQS